MSTGFPILDRLLGSESNATRDDLLDILTSPTFTAEHVSLTLTEAGHPVSASTIRTFRRARKAAALASATG